MVASRKVEIPFYRSIGRQRLRGFGELQKLLGNPQFLFCVNISSQPQNFWVLTLWNLLFQKQQMLAVEKISRHLQRTWENEV